MNILFYLAHPSQYHFLKNVIRLLRKGTHKVTIVIKSKDILEDLLIGDREEFINILPEGRNNNTSSLGFALLKRDWRLYKFLHDKNFDLLIGSDAAIAQIGRLLGIPCITCLEDDYKVIPNLARLTFPFTDVILTPISCDVGRWKHKQIVYHGYQKLAYLHPSYFTPDKNKVCKYKNNNYFLIRLSGLSAHHDKDIKGLNDELIKAILCRLSKKGEVLISSEEPLDNELEKYRLDIASKDIHHYLFYANLFLSDSQSMTVESAMLGTPSIRFSDFAGRIGVLEELEHRYGLTFGMKTSESERLLQKLDELLIRPNLKEEWQEKRQKMLSEKIDVSAFLLWLIENYPKSITEMRNNPDIQFQFK